MMGAGIVVLAMWAWFGYRGQVVMAKKIEPESVKVRFLVEGANGQAGGRGQTTEDGGQKKVGGTVATKET